MAVPLQVQLFNAFLGSQEGIHSIILPDVFSPGGTLNLYIDKYGRAKRIDGYAKTNNSAITINSNGNATHVSGLFHYSKTSGGSTTRQCLGTFDAGVNGHDLRVSSDAGVTWTFKYAFSAAAGNQWPDFAQYGDNCFITNGKTTPQVWNGTSIANAGGSQSPTPNAVASSDAGNLTGVYKYKLVARVDDNSRKYGSAASGLVEVTGKQVGLTWTADADTHVVGYEVYRTSGTGTIFYYLTYVNGRTTAAYTDNTSDITLVLGRALSEHGDAPPTTYYVEPHQQRMWWLKSDTYPTRAWWSDPGAPDSVYAENYLDFSDPENEGDQIVGARGGFGSSLAVFTERAVYMVGGSGQVVGLINDWNRQRKNAQTGCVSDRAIVRVPKGARYMDQTGQVQDISSNALAYFTPLGDIRLFDGDDDLVISHPLKDTLATFNYANKAAIHCLHDAFRSQFIWFFPSDGSSLCDTAAVWNYRWGTWYIWSPMPFSASMHHDTSSEANMMMVGQADLTVGGYTYEFFTGNSFDGATFTSKWMTKTLHGNVGQIQPTPGLSYTKRWRWADLLFQVNQGTTLLVEWLTGDATDDAAAVGSEFVFPGTVGLLTVDGATLVTASSDPLKANAVSAQGKVLLKDPTGSYLHDPGMRLRITDTSSNGSWALEAFSLAYQTLPGLYRRSG